MQKTIYVIDDQECFRESCDLVFGEKYRVECFENLDDFEERIADNIGNISAVIVDNCLGRHTAIDCGFADMVRMNYNFRGKIILFSVSTEFNVKQRTELEKYDAVWDKENDIILSNLDNILQESRSVIS